jgi:hypothetical protein
VAIKVPPFEEPGLTDFLVRVFEERDRSRTKYLNADTGNYSLLLQSPSKKVYEIKVDDAGAISAVLVSG